MTVVGFPDMYDRLTSKKQQPSKAVGSCFSNKQTLVPVNDISKHIKRNTSEKHLLIVRKHVLLIINIRTIIYIYANFRRKKII